MNELVPNLRDKQVKSALKKLITFSLSIIAVPLTSMFLLKRYFFEVVLGYSSSDSLLYSAIVAVVLVHVVLGFFVYAAYQEEDRTRIPDDTKRD